ncbi:tyrosine--tRNA ligase, partial [Burkholderia multivorans]
LAIGQLLKQAGLVPSIFTPPCSMLRSASLVDGTTVSDKGLKVDAGEYVVQVGKRRFARVTLAA